MFATGLLKFLKKLKIYFLVYCYNFRESNNCPVMALIEPQCLFQINMAEFAFLFILIEEFCVVNQTRNIDN